MFHVKICGVTTPDDARRAAEAGADAVGLNFVAGSPRRLDVAAARAVRAAVPRGVLVVGVFAGVPADEIKRVVEAVGLDAVQLHGRFGADDAADPPERCRDLAPLPVIRAVRLDPATSADRLATARRWIDAARQLGHTPSMAIVDASVASDTAAGQLGGTGATVDWEAFAQAPGLDIPTALAGGLTADNVATAIRATGTRAVDTASGVEASPGRKDPAKLQAFVTAARAAMGLG